MRSLCSNAVGLIARAASHQPRAVIGSSGLTLILAAETVLLIVRQHGA